MARRLLTDIISDLNQALSNSFTVTNIEYNNLAKLTPKGESIGVIARDGSNLSGKLLAPSRANNGIMYHRIIDQSVDKRSGKGRDSIELITTTVKLVAWIKRPQGRNSKANWDDQELLNECCSIVNQNTWLSRNESSKVVEMNSDFLQILGEEIGNPDQNKKVPYELTLFTVDYQVTQLVKCSYDDPNSSTALVSLSYSNNGQSILEAVADGASSFQDMTPTLLPLGGTVNYYSPDLSTGLSLNSSTGVISEDTFNSIPIGLNSFTVTATGAGNYSGSVSFTVFFIKKEVYVLTQAEYDALTEIEDSMYYLILE